MTPTLGMFIFLGLCIGLILLTGHKVTHDPEPGKVGGFDLRIEFKDPKDLELAHQFAQATIDHLMETFNDDDSIRYISYDVPESEIPE